MKPARALLPVPRVPPILLKLPDKVRQVILTAALSLAAGLSAVAFLFMTNLFFEKTYVAFAARSKVFFVVASFLLIVTASALVGLLLKAFGPEAAGSGIPQVKSSFWKELGAIEARPVLAKFLGGVLSIGGGQSLGREGPSVYIGAGVASNASGLLGTPPRERRGAAIVGASAGLAAAFNTPLAAIAFAIEEIIGDLNSRFLGRVVLASVLGAFVVYAFLGRQPAFILPAVENVSWIHYAAVPVIAFVAATLGRMFQGSTLPAASRLKRETRLPRWLFPVFGGVLTWLLGVSAFLATGKLGVFGLGYRDLSSALTNDFDWRVAGLLVLAKLLATIFSYGFGGCGGIFAPSLFLGGMSGYFLGGLLGLWLPLTPADRIVLSAVGMSACLGAIVRAPLTSMLIVFEMTHQFTLVPGLLLGTIVSQAVARLCRPAQLLRRPARPGRPRAPQGPPAARPPELAEPARVGDRQSPPGRHHGSVAAYPEKRRRPAPVRPLPPRQQWTLERDRLPQRYPVGTPRRRDAGGSPGGDLPSRPVGPRDRRQVHRFSGKHPRRRKPRERGCRRHHHPPRPPPGPGLHSKLTGSLPLPLSIAFFA